MNKKDCCGGGHESPDKQTEDKLYALEHSLQEKPSTDLPASVPTQDLMKVTGATPLKDDFYYFSGIALIAFGLLFLFNHIRVGTGLFQFLGFSGQGFGFLLLPLLVGLGLIVYNPKNKFGYLLLSLGCALIFYAVLASLIMTFPPMSLLAMIFMLAPMAIGGAFVVKGLGGPKGVESKLREQGLIKKD